ncbi:unnamed protein product [Rhizophagus irregularis]|nr:unnamed protein product [Rhizophagus irregularis]
MDKDINQFNQAEEIRLELTKSKSIGPEFNGTTHSEAIYTSRSLGSFISKFLTPLKQEYVTKEFEFDIDDIQRTSGDFIIQNSRDQHILTNTSKPQSKAISKINLLGKRNIDETHVNNNKEYIFKIS